MPDTGAPAKRKLRTNLDFYHSPTQMRFDTWNRLDEYANRLSAKQMRKADMANLMKQTREALTLLNTFENYSAFPSQEDFELLWQLFSEEEFELLSRIVTRIVRALTGGTYRSRQINLRASAELDERGELSQHHDELSHQQRPYFEVLVVDESGPEDVSCCAIACVKSDARKIALSTISSLYKASKTR